MTTKTVYQLDDQGNYVGPTTADESPLEPGVWLIPNGCITQAPPREKQGTFRHWDGSQWHQVEVPQ